MILQIKQLTQKTAVLIGCCAACGGAGFLIPLMSDRDVGGALASEIFGLAGLIVIKRNFD
jgi:hypothetical protein